MARLLTLLALVFAAAASAQPDKGSGLRVLGVSAEELAAATPASPNPFLAFLEPGVAPDFEYWTAKTAFDGLRRGRTRAARGFRSAPSATYRERERAVFNRNDGPGDAERIPAELFGSAADEPIVEITGVLEPPAGDPQRVSVTTEDAASGAVVPFQIAVAEGAAVAASARIGDGPFAASGDVDAYDVVVPRAGMYVEIAVRTPTGDLDPKMALYDPAGQWVVTVDDTDGYDPVEGRVLDRAGTYRLFVWGYTPGGGELADRADAGSAGGAGSTGPYTLHVSNARPDVDAYAVDLVAGDVIGVATGAPVEEVTITGPDGSVRMRSQTDITGLYPDDGPLLSPAEVGAAAGGVSAAAIAPVAGTYTVSVTGEGPYTLVVQGARPGHERPGGRPVQTLYVEFGGGTYHPARELDGTRETATLSPLRAFLPRWGLTAADEDAVVDAVLATLARTLRDDLRAMPGLAGLDLRVLNDRDHPDPGPGANRLVIAGTSEEIGADGFLGQASTVDVGNFRQDDVAYVVLGQMSDPAGTTGSSSINQFAVAAGRTKAELVGLGVGTVAAHEAGHFFGLHHTENDNAVRNVQDAGGYDLALGFDIGADRVFGPGDGDGVAFRVDDLFTSHAFTGVQRSPEALALGLHSTGGRDLPPSGALAAAGFSPAAIAAAGGRGGEALLSASFASDPAGDWAQDNAAGRAAVADGVLRMTGAAGQTLRERGGRDFWVTGDVALRVRLRHVAGCDTHGAGFYFGWQDQAYNLAFADVAGASWTRLNRYTGDGWDGLSEWEATTAARPDDWNALELVVAGTTAQLFLNGAFVRAVDVPAVTGEFAAGGLLVNGCSEEPMTYAFDDFAVVTLGHGAARRSFQAAPRDATDAGPVAPDAEAPASD